MVYWVPCGGLEEAAARRPCWHGDPLCEQLRTVAQKFLFLSLCQVARGKNLGYSLSSVQGRVPRNHRVVAQLGSALDWGSRGRRFKSCHPDAENALIGRTIGWGVLLYLVLCIISYWFWRLTQCAWSKASYDRKAATLAASRERMPLMPSSLSRQRHRVMVS